LIRFLAAQASGSTSSSSDPFESVSNFFDSGAWTVSQFLLQVFVFLLWIALIYWTYRDAQRRIESAAFVALSVALSVVIPFLGSIIYLIIRPPEYLDEARERELELLALEHRLAELGDAEGQEIVGKILAREGLTADSGNLQRSLRQAGVASTDDVRDIDQRLTELEFRMRLFDRATIPTQDGASDAAARSSERTRTSRELPESTGGTGTGTTSSSTSDTGRSPRWRRPRSDQESYE
jgi:hypothetical protein